MSKVIDKDKGLKRINKILDKAQKVRVEVGIFKKGMAYPFILNAKTGFFNSGVSKFVDKIDGSLKEADLLKKDADESLRILAENAVAEIKDEIRAYEHIDTGKMLDSVTWRVKKDK